MMRKHIALLCFGLIFIVSSNIVGALIIFDINSHRNVNSNILPIDQSPLVDEEHNSGDTSIATIVEPTINELIDILIKNITDSPDECWRKPASNRKNTMINKLTTLKDMVSLNNLEGAYDKLLHDIKPKLTGLKTDENEEEWGNGTFKNPWVICGDYNLDFQIDCNEILSLLKNFNQLY